ncbi:MAG: hypothetical protein OEV73_09285 [Desulfobulbaceae bacterium]|nr:hypothetical protein [Desulfobulbaceae bacterium]
MHMGRLNCWEVKQCGRGPENGTKPVCPAARPGKYDGVNGGTFAGRFCWAVAGTFCSDNEEQGTFAEKFRDCLNCNFLQQVDIEEGRFLVLTPYEIELMGGSENIYH